MAPTSSAFNFSFSNFATLWRSFIIIFRFATSETGTSGKKRQNVSRQVCLWHFVKVLDRVLSSSRERGLLVWLFPPLIRRDEDVKRWSIYSSSEAILGGSWSESYSSYSSMYSSPASESPSAGSSSVERFSRRTAQTARQSSRFTYFPCESVVSNGSRDDEVHPEAAFLSMDRISSSSGGRSRCWRAEGIKSNGRWVGSASDLHLWISELSWLEVVEVSSARNPPPPEIGSTLTFLLFDRRDPETWLGFMERSKASSIARRVRLGNVKKRESEEAMLWLVTNFGRSAADNLYIGALHYEISISSPPMCVTCSSITNFLTSSFFQAVVPLLNL